MLAALYGGPRCQRNFGVTLAVAWTMASHDKHSWANRAKERLGSYLGLSVALLYARNFYIGSWQNKTGVFLYVCLIFFLTCVGVTSISITIFNKQVLTGYKFNYANTLALGQAIFTLIFLTVLRHFKFIDFPSLSLRTLNQAKWLIFCFIGMVVTGLASLAFVNIAMYSVLRRLTTCITLFGELIILKRVIPIDEQASVYAMIGGAIFAGVGDLEFNVTGYVLIFVNCLFTAGYLIFIKISQNLGLSDFALMYYSNVVGLPIYATMVWMTELEGVLDYDGLFEFGFVFSFLMSSMHAFLLNWFIFLCSTINSPLTTSITGQLKNVITTIAGFFLFGGAPMTPTGALGLCGSTVASVWYGYIKYNQAEAARALRMQQQDIDGKLSKV